MAYRDVACVDGLIKFVELERRVTVTIIEIPPEKPSDPRNKDVLYDSDLIKLYNRKHVDCKPKTLRSANGWSAMTWTRELGSDRWLKGSIVDADDILVDDSALSALQRNESAAGSLTFRSMYSAYPILSTDGNDVLYLKSSRKLVDPYGWAVAVDLAEKTLKVEAPEAPPFGRYYPSRQRFLPCALVNHLKRTPGIKVSAIQNTQTGSSANEPNNTANCVGEPDSYKSENKRPRHGSYSAMRTLFFEDLLLTQDGAQSTVQNVLSSHARPDQNNMPPQLCFNRWEEPCYGGHLSCPPKNNSPLPQCFNKSTGPSNHVYAPLAPAPDIRSYDNYQSLWQQPLLPEQQTAPSRAYGIHVAPHPYFNNWLGSTHHGNSQQHPAGNTYSYCAHSGSGNQGFGYRPIYHDY
ncbi:hypothetical protein ACQ4PT_022367 [Festuca glaucescens]